MTRERHKNKCNLQRLDNTIILIIIQIMHFLGRHSYFIMGLLLSLLLLSPCLHSECVLELPSVDKLLPLVPSATVITLGIWDSSQTVQN